VIEISSITITHEALAGRDRMVRAQAYRDAADDIDHEYTGPNADRNARYAAQFLRRRAHQIETGDTQ
jgi:hypothetical protein